jgi:putative hemolysin
MNMISFELLVIFILLLLNAFFALSEMAIVSSSKALLRQKAKQGNTRAALALRLAEDSGRFLSTVQVGITLVGTLAGAYGGAEIADKLAPVFDEIAFLAPHGELVAVVLVVAAITYLSVVIGELIPKQLALSNPEALAMCVARPMHMLSIICTPIVFALEGSANAFFKLFGIRREAEKITETEVKAMLAEATASGAIEKAEHDMLNRIIRLGDRNVESIMTHRMDITFIDIKDSFSAICEKVHKAGHSRYPVVDGDITNVIGVVQAKELLDAALTYSDDLHILDHLKEAPFIPEGTKCLTVLDLFKTSSAHIAIVVNEYGAVEGIVTTSDVLEAIVGMMPSNYGHDDDAIIIQREDGSWLVDGATPIDEIHLSIGLEEISANASFETIAGFLLHTMGQIPAAGESMERFGYRFEVVDLDGRQIDKILITPLKNKNDGANI